MLDVHGKSLKENTIKALKLVKEYLIGWNGYLDVPIIKQLLKSVKNSYDKYDIELEKQRKLELKEAGDAKKSMINEIT